MDGGPDSYRNYLLLRFGDVSGKEYPNSSEKAITLFLHFSKYIFLCEHGFSSCISSKIKYHNRLSATDRTSSCVL